MKIHEYQAKELLRQYGVTTPQGIPAFSKKEALEAAKTLGGPVWVVKAQIHAGGRGKGGGVKVATDQQQLEQYVDKIFGMTLVTHQTGSEGQLVRRLLIEEGAQIEDEYYLGIVTDRDSQRDCIMASSEGGTEIEEVAEKTPELIHKVLVNPSTGLTEQEALLLAQNMGIPATSCDEAAKLIMALYRAYEESDASLMEINPLIVTAKGEVVALDAKINFDENALFRHKDYDALRDLSEEDPYELEAAEAGLSFISLDGNIGCLVNGAGLAMATMDIIKLYGGEPANFLDVGGGATKEQVTEAFRIMTKNPDLDAILVNIFGGIMRCDVIAEGLVAAAKEIELNLPLVVRLEGTNVDLGKKILEESGMAITPASTMADAAEKVVQAATGEEV